MYLYYPLCLYCCCWSKFVMFDKDHHCSHCFHHHGHPHGHPHHHRVVDLSYLNHLNYLSLLILLQYPDQSHYSCSLCSHCYYLIQLLLVAQQFLLQFLLCVLLLQLFLLLLVLLVQPQLHQHQPGQHLLDYLSLYLYSLFDRLMVLVLTDLCHSLVVYPVFVSHRAYSPYCPD